MKGCAWYFNVKELKISKVDSVFMPKKLARGRKTYFAKLRRAGRFNGDILGCFDYTFSGNRLYLNCGKIRFFDFLASRKKESVPMLVNVNAVIKVGNSVLLVKRKGRVFSYRGYWDYPAGLVFFKDTPFTTLNDRIKNDTKMPLSYFSKGRLFAAGIHKWYLCLFYLYNLKISENKLKEIIKDADNIQLLELDKKKLFTFLKNNKLITPEILNHLAS